MAYARGEGSAKVEGAIKGGAAKEAADVPE